MLSARSDSSGGLELVRLALVMIRGGQNNIPVELKSHFYRVINEAKCLRDTPEKLEDSPLPESIVLAYEIGAKDRLSYDIEQVSDMDSVTPDLAGRLLAEMESSIVHVDKLTTTP